MYVYLDLVVNCCCSGVNGLALLTHPFWTIGGVYLVYWPSSSGSDPALRYPVRVGTVEELVYGTL